MTSDQQRIAFAEFCGWTSINDVFGKPAWLRPDGITVYELPNYTEDLNAIHEAEKMLNLHQSDRYARALACVNNADQWTSHFRAAHATAAQRCEALLRTVGKWVEEWARTLDPGLRSLHWSSGK